MITGETQWTRISIQIGYIKKHFANDNNEDEGNSESGKVKYIRSITGIQNDGT